MHEDFFEDEAKFLNRHGLISGIRQIFKNSISEILILVPFIKVSDIMWEEMKEAEKKGKHIVIVYRENSMTASEKSKIATLKNITLLHHPHIHSKCYINENHIIICSMNLYEHSELNNREMGIISSKDSFNEIYYDALGEIQSIFNASTLEKKSDFVLKNGFNIDILKTDEEVIRKYLDKINNIFINKKFVIQKDEYDSTQIICESYYEDIDVVLEYDIYDDLKVDIRRIKLKLNFNIDYQIELQSKFWMNFQYLNLDHFKIYWYKKKDISIYGNLSNNPKWNDLSFEQNLKKLKQGLDILISFTKNNKQNKT